MAIIPQLAIGAEYQPIEFEFDNDDVILYHLGLGAGVPSTSPEELKYTYEGSLVTLPAYGVIPSLYLVMQMPQMEGLDFDMAKMLHGEQHLTVHRPLPTSGRLTSTGRVVEVWDKGSGALVVTEAVTSDDDGPLVSNRISAFLRGEGGFSGEKGPSTGKPSPDRKPDYVLRSPTMPQQALIYRLSGDKNPLHADPDFAARGGFDRPILHGLSTYGVVCRAVVDSVLGGDVTRVKEYMARFAGVVFPGETVVTSVWVEDGTMHISATTEERGEPVLSNAYITTA